MWQNPGFAEGLTLTRTGWGRGIFGIFTVWEQFCGAGSVLGAGSSHLFVFQGQCELCKCCSPHGGADQGHRLHPGWGGRGPNLLLCVFMGWKVPGETQHKCATLCLFEVKKNTQRNSPQITKRNSSPSVALCLFGVKNTCKISSQMCYLVSLLGGKIPTELISNVLLCVFLRWKKYSEKLIPNVLFCVFLGWKNAHFNWVSLCYFVSFGVESTCKNSPQMCSFVSFWDEKIPRETQPQMFCFVSLLGIKSPQKLSLGG